ncbi:MAG TPA: hypothetical protein VHS31_02185 [Tepidisphaeraceae bacterium]|jgi:hypothetical protein|nr:hypothetical protein [Tepidisphaeraceae bacterium]
MRFTFALAFKNGKAPKGTELWKMINSGPAILRPTSVNTFEPLRKIQNVDLAEVCKEEFIWRNGRKCLGVFNPNGWKGKATLSTLLEYPEVQHEALTREVYEFIKASFEYRLLYGVSPTNELMELNLEVHQLANCGAIPPNEKIITANKTLYDFFEEHA